MKKYIILALNITNMGGVHQYCRNKCDAVKKLGYTPMVFSGTKGNIYIPELQLFDKNIYTELRYPPYCFTKKRIERTVSSIIKQIGIIEDGAVIESLTIATSEWGEIIGQKLNAKCVNFILDEQYDASDEELDFLKFKHSRKELAGIKKQSLELLFGNKYKIPQEELYYISALCTNVVADYSYKIPYEKGANVKVIGSIGRLDKGYVLPMIRQLSEYFLKKPEQKYILCLVGGSNNNRISDSIKQIMKSIPNVDIYITGYIYPIPRNLLHTFDVSIGTSGGANITALYENIPTISVDTHSGTPIGLLNYTTKESTYSQGNFRLSDLLDDVLVKNVTEKMNKLGMIAPIDTFNEEVQRSMIMFVNTSIPLKYYDIYQLKAKDKKYKLYSFIGKTLGSNALTYIHKNVFQRLKMQTKR